MRRANYPEEAGQVSFECLATARRSRFSHENTGCAGANTR